MFTLIMVWRINKTEGIRMVYFKTLMPRIGAKIKYKYDTEIMDKKSRN